LTEQRERDVVFVLRSGADWFTRPEGVVFLKSDKEIMMKKLSRGRWAASERTDRCAGNGLGRRAGVFQPRARNALIGASNRAPLRPPLAGGAVPSGGDFSGK